MQNTNIGMGNVKVQRKALNNRFFFIEPAPAKDAHELCMRLAKSQGIEKVYLAEGPYGYIVRTKGMGEQKVRTFVERLRTQGMRCKSAETFYEYQKIAG
jgi:hypothetical protein